jgi:signal transduction histidine kinase/ActR/RegA family two-component response regulator
MTSAESVATRERIQKECRQLVLAQGRAGAFATLAVAVLFLWTLRDVHSRELLAGWAVAVGLASALRIWLASPAQWRPDANGDSRSGTPLGCILLGALCGGVWGVAATLLFPMGHNELYFVIAFLLISMPAAATSSFGAWWPAHTAYVLCNIGPFALYFLLSGQADFVVAGVAACFFAAFLLRQGFVVSRTIQHNIAQRTALMTMTRTLGEALDRADAANRAKSTFLTNMSHELRTPLNAIIGMSELLAEAPDAPQHRQLPHSIHRAGQSLLALISDVLDLSQVEAGKIVLHPAPFAPRRLIDGVLDMFAPEADARSLVLDAVCAPDVPERFVGDQARLRQVLVNLVGNAIKFTAAGSVRIEVDLLPGEDAPRRLRIAVVDTGPGIAAHARTRIFSAFQQGDDSVSRAHSGTGLGLKISSDLIALMGGRIDLDSTPGVGSRFAVIVPEAESSVLPDDAGRPQATAAPPASAIGGLRVLVVEDNALNASLVKLMLERDGCTVECAGSGARALERMGQDRWDVVLMDCQMPDIDGYAATRRWRQTEIIERRPRLSIIALTAHALADDRRRCLEAGMDDYLTKPVKLESLRGALARHASPASAPSVEAPADADRETAPTPP